MAEVVGLAGRTVTGMAFSLYDGKATWDRAGKFASTITKHYSFNGMAIAMQEGSTLRYLHSDHLSSNTLVTNADGTLHSSQNYCAYGQKRFATWYGSECDPTAPNTLPTDRTFTGQEQDTTGLMCQSGPPANPQISSEEKIISSEETIRFLTRNYFFFTRNQPAPRTPRKSAPHSFGLPPAHPL